MRHLMEVMLVIEEKEEWARSLGEKRRQQGLPMPSVDFVNHAIANKRQKRSCMLIKRLAETMDKTIAKMVISFI